MSGLNPAWRSKSRPEAPAAAGMAVEEGEEDKEEEGEEEEEEEDKYEDIVGRPPASAKKLKSYTNPGPAPGFALPAAAVGDAAEAEWIVFEKHVQCHA